MKWKILFLGLVFLFVGCSQRQTQKVLEKFVNTSIQIPPMILMQNGGLVDSLSIDSISNIKLVTYYTSAKGCLSCWISHLNDFEQTFDAELITKFTPVVIISLADDNFKDVFNQLKIQPHAYPIYLDEHQEFAHANPNLPADGRFHTFLLDKHNRVVLVGNPLASDAMMSLFRSTLDNMLSHDGVYVPEK